MKRLIFAIALMACVPLFGQDIPNNVPRRQLFPADRPTYSFFVFRTAAGYRITAFNDQITIIAMKMERVGNLSDSTCLLKLTGNVEVTVKGVRLEADEADYHCQSGEIEPRGNVHFT